MSRRKLARAQAYFERHGGKTVFFGRFVAFLRMFAALLAGVGRMPYGRFLTYNVLGGVCWAVVMGSLGVVVILVVASVLYRRRHQNKVAAELSQ